MSSATTDSRSAGSKIENPGFKPAAFASLRRILRPSAWNVAMMTFAASPALPCAFKQRLRALAHFARRLVGERDRDDARRVDALLDQVGDLGRDDARLPAAGAGQHEQRTVDVAHRFALGRV